MSLSKPYGFTEKRIKAEIKSLIPNKDQFYSANNSKCFDSKKECMVEYKIKSTYQSALCGTAFDYLARFCIARIAEYNREESLHDLVAERFIKSTFDLYTIEVDEKTKERFKHKNIHFSLPNGIVCGEIRSYSYLSKICDAPKEELQKLISKDLIKIRHVPNSKNVLDDLKNQYNRLLEPIRQYIKGDFVDDEILIDISIVLAKMEQMRRSGWGAVLVNEIFDYDTENLCVKDELKRMLVSFRKVFLPIVTKDSIVVYNPHFGIGSRMVGGADADVYMDGVLYDFKTTIKNGWSSADVTQIIGYYLLDIIAKKCNDKRNQLNGYPVDKIALYKVRYEEITYFDVKCISKEAIENTVKAICHTYLVYNMSSLIFWSKDDEIIKKYNIPLSKRKISDFCTVRAKEELDWYISQEHELAGILKQRKEKIEQSQMILKEHLDDVDILKLLKELVQELNSYILKTKG